ncbi:uncharacterized protein LOC129759542 [Uranotaenia lowii]|uniref:uncharacterized protein LOC129759542 n=1 Tax=Uranotaenia lowii TaxID=190385 RepID=UPI0024783DD3|nr:uncharacterized protein LOC129759542 [Uranotaenia lowii]
MFWYSQMKLLGLLFMVVVAAGRSIDTIDDFHRSVDFTLDFFRMAHRQNDAGDNLVMSPVSIRSALSMLFHAAHPETASEMQQFLRLSADPEKVVKNLQKYIGYNNEALRIAFKVFHSKNEEIKPSFLHSLKTIYEMEMEPVDFRKPELVSDLANSWIRKATNGMIQDLVDPMDLDTQANLLMLNAVALNASWNLKFNSDATDKATFNYLNGNQEVDMMYQEDDFRYANLDGVKVIELSYEPQTDLAMWILLPEQDTFDTFIQNFNLETYNQIEDHLDDVKVILQMPKFSVNHNTPAKKILRTMGLEKMFDEGVFDLSNEKPSKLADIQHRARIDVTEDGVSAAAVTELQFVLLSGPPKVVHFTADRPILILPYTGKMSLRSIVLVIALFQSAFCLSTENAVSSNKFTFDMFKRVFKSDKNAVLSPTSLRMALAMFYPLAGNEVSPDMQTRMYLQPDKQVEVGNLEQFIGELNSDPTESLKVRVKMYHTDAELNPEVLPLFRDRFRAQVEVADFQDVDAVVNSINQWVKEETKNLITKYMEPGDLRVDNDMLVLSVVALNASWAVPFNAEHTQPKLFHFTNGDQQVQMMHLTGEFLYDYMHKLNMHVLELLYEKQTDLSMMLILPSSRTTLQQTVDLLNADFYAKLDEELTPTTLDVFIPKFTAKYKLDAKELLKEMGLKSLFERFDLHILERDRSRIGEVRQTTHVKVDEVGTVAVAVTEVQATGRSATPIFYANRPFLYLIRKRSSKQILFVGHFSVHEDEQAN